MKSYVATVVYGDQSRFIRIRATNIMTAIDHLKVRLYEFKGVTSVDIHETGETVES